VADYAFGQPEIEGENVLKTKECHAPRKRGIQYSLAPVADSAREPKRFAIPDRRLSRAMTVLREWRTPFIHPGAQAGHESLSAWRAR
jgi:hypothetical protein